MPTYNATSAGGTMSYAGLKEYFVMRGSTGDDYLIGGDAGGRFSAGGGNDTLIGGAGADGFFLVQGQGGFATIDGRGGTDTLNITLTSTQLADPAVMAALKALNGFFTYTLPNDPTAHFVNATLGIDMTGMEAANVRLDGVVKTLDQIGATATRLIGFEDLASLPGFQADGFSFLPSGYKGYDWTSPGGTLAIDAGSWHATDGYGPPAGSVVALAVDFHFTPPS